MLLQLRVLLETRLEDGQIVSMDAFTLVVNAHGGLLEIGMKLPIGHEITLTSPATRAKAPCHVVGIRKSQDGFFAVAFEFEKPSPDFWPMSFLRPDWQLANSR